MFVAALVLRVAYVLVVHKLSAQPSSDSIAYDQLGWNLARGMGFQLNGESALYPTAKAPVLPYLVSLLYRATGHVYFAALLMQCLIGALVPVLVRALGRTMFGFNVGCLIDKDAYSMAYGAHMENRPVLELAIHGREDDAPTIFP